MNWKKCDFHQASLQRASHQISAAGISPTDSSIGQVQRLVVPQQKSDLKVSLGNVGCFQDMTPNFGFRAHVLTELLLTNAHLDWTRMSQSALEDLKETVLEIVPLQSFDPHAPIQVHADAFDFAASAVLLQPCLLVPSKWCPVEYRSKKFDKHQRICVSMKFGRSSSLARNSAIFSTVAILRCTLIKDQLHRFWILHAHQASPRRKWMIALNAGRPRSFWLTSIVSTGQGQCTCRPPFPQPQTQDRHRHTS